MTDLSLTLAGVTLKNPILPASGTYEAAEMGNSFFDPSELGAVINKTIFMDSRPGNPAPRIYETSSGMLNSIGIPSEGCDAFIENQLPRLKDIGIPVVVSIAEYSIETFCLLAEKIERTGMADLLELDLSCPNVELDAQWSEDKGLLREVIQGVTEAVKLPVIAKLTPLVSDIGEMARVAQDSGASALCLINTFRGMAIDIETGKPVLGSTIGGLSGPAIHPLAVYAVFEAFKKVSIPIIGVGGVTSWKDALEFILAGAACVGVGTYNFLQPAGMKEIINGLKEYCEGTGIEHLRELVGKAHP